MDLKIGDKILVLHNLHNPLSVADSFSEYTVTGISGKDISTESGKFYADFCRLATVKNRQLLTTYVRLFLTTTSKLQSAKFQMLNLLDK